MPVKPCVREYEDRFAVAQLDLLGAAGRACGTGAQLNQEVAGVDEEQVKVRPDARPDLLRRVKLAVAVKVEMNHAK